MRIFGFTFGKNEEDIELNSPIIPDKTEGSIDIPVTMPGFISPMSSVLDLSGTAQTENEFITRYRETSMIPEVDECVEEITSEAIIYPDDETMPVTIDCDNVDIDDNTKEIIQEEFVECLKLLNFRQRGHDIFKRWYIDGRYNLHAVVDHNNVAAGIQALRYIDPRKIKKIRELMYDRESQTGNMVIRDVKEYFIFNESGLMSSKYSPTMAASQALQIQANNVILTTDSVIYFDSGLMDPSLGFVISHLHRAMRPANNMVMMEDAMLIYRLARAPERRVFYIDTGNLPKAKAEQYVEEIARKNRTKVAYDSSTGAIKNDKRYMAMTEDYWLPRKEGSKGTEISTLQGGESVGETAEPEYFKSKLYRALKVPASRFSDQPSLFSSGTEITRDEVRFSRFIDRLRARFNDLWLELLGRQLILKGYMNVDEWDDIKGELAFNYQSDTYFTEALKSQLMLQRLAILEEIDPFIGKYFTRDYVFKDILEMTDEEIKERLSQIEAEMPQLQDFEMMRQMAADPMRAQDMAVASKQTNEDWLENLAKSEIALNEKLEGFLKK